MKKFILSTQCLFALLLTTPLAANAQSGGYYGRDSYRRDDYREDDYRDDRAERRELERERLRLEDERNQLERDRMRNQASAPVAVQRAESCPSGFQPSERKCSDAERRKGCKDMRLPGGLGCVSR